MTFIIAAYCEIFAYLFELRLLYFIVSDDIKTPYYKYHIGALSTKTMYNSAVKAVLKCPLTEVKLSFALLKLIY